MQCTLSRGEKEEVPRFVREVRTIQSVFGILRHWHVCRFSLAIAIGSEVVIGAAVAKKLLADPLITLYVYGTLKVLRVSKYLLGTRKESGL